MPKPPTLWNRMGSTTQLSNSVVGQNLSQTGTPTHPSGKFGNAYDPAVSNYSTFTQDLSGNGTHRAGTIEMWVDFNDPGVTTQYMIVGNSDDVSPNQWSIFFNRGAALDLDWRFGGAQLGCNGFDSFYGTTFHIAFVWDRDGIEGGSDIRRIYKDGSQLASSTATIGADTLYTNSTLYIGIRHSNTNPWTDWIDNFKLFDYAKTDFNDRFNERGSMNDQIYG